MAQRYIIYIKDTPLFITQPNVLPKDTIFLRVNEHTILNEVKKTLIGETHQPMLFESSSPKETMAFLCEIFECIEAAGGLVKNVNEEYLFIYRLGKWDLPKGKLETGESVVECAVREVEEECGITVNSVSHELPSTYHVYELKNKLILKRTYWFAMDYKGNGKLIPQIEESIEAVKWLPKEEFNVVLNNTYPAIKGLLEDIK
ncbi:NUDIX hydrolase [Solitalea lacus]|uniref:NUDIX hydrolase n=1 Tax=Solitalea lacus TaxID=2911172 RepID=UPI001EDBB725|nr:NUDIX domain-containing protein [Solitalea lacus]UKJ09048.1 NUDIX domain-containing protein [Solitalea lacus]